MSRVGRSLAFSFIDKYGAFALNILGTAVVSRLLSPQEFGVFAVAAAVAMLIEVLRDFGVGTYLVQAPEITRERVRSALTIALLLSLGCAVALLLVAAPLARLYGAPEIDAILWLYALSFLLVAVSAPNMNLLRRDLMFGAIAAINLASSVIGLMVMLGLAVAGFGPISLAWSVVATATARAILAMWRRPMFWAFRPSFADWRNVVRFGGYSSATAAINVLHDAMPSLILGRAFGMEGVALYSRALTICQLPDRLVVSALQPVILPAMAEHVRGGGDVRAAYLSALAYMSALQWPMLLGLALLADPAVLLMFGGQWTEAASLVRLVALGSLALFPAFMTYPLLVALGHVRDTLVMSLISVPPSILAIWAASFFGLHAVAAVTFVTAPLQVAVAVAFISRRIDVTWPQIWRATRKSALVALIAAAPAASVVALKGFSFALSIGEMFATTAAGAAFWLAGLYAIGHPLSTEVSAAVARARRRAG